MAALKLRIPSPIPLPSEENLLVPKSRRAIAITNNQCQSENSPITPPFRKLPANVRKTAEAFRKSLGYRGCGVKEAGLKHSRSFRRAVALFAGVPKLRCIRA